mmetsp:Transcript_23146/g.44199  ORF Transcript_23146/g.44199 Transcript_23146/m.44199 type:complete len:226 (+) Transcript_23146:531-1208(+)
MFKVPKLHLPKGRRALLWSLQNWPLYVMQQSRPLISIASKPRVRPIFHGRHLLRRPHATLQAADVFVQALDFSILVAKGALMYEHTREGPRGKARLAPTRGRSELLSQRTSRVPAAYAPVQTAMRAAVSTVESTQRPFGRAPSNAIAVLIHAIREHVCFCLFLVQLQNLHVPSQLVDFTHQQDVLVQYLAVINTVHLHVLCKLSLQALHCTLQVVTLLFILFLYL